MLKIVLKIGINIGFGILCYGLLWNDFLHVSDYTAQIAIIFKLIIFLIGFIVMNVFFVKPKLITGICLGLMIIISGAVVGDIIYNSLPAPQSNVDWFGDGVN